MADLSVLRTAKLALDEGLIADSDYSTVKEAFVRAQQIKAGMDAGFLREEDFVHARDSFLAALDFEVPHGSHAAAPAAPAAGTSRPFAGATAAAAAPVASTSARRAEAPRTVQQPAPATAPPPAALLHGQNGSAAAASAGSFSSDAGAAPSAPMPALDELQRLVKPGIAAGKKSMSGISVNEQCVNVYNHMKTKSTYKWVTFKIDDAGKDVVVDQLGPSTSSYAEFVAAIPDQLCRYGVYDYAYQNADTHHTVNKLVFVNWAPDSASIRTKMMYASSKDFFKGFLDGVGAELQATDPQELAESEMKERIYQALTRK